MSSQQLFSEMVGFQMDDMKNFIRVTIMFLGCMWAAWVIHSASQKIKGDMSVFDFLMSVFESIMVMVLVSFIIC